MTIRIENFPLKFQRAFTLPFNVLCKGSPANMSTFNVGTDIKPHNKHEWRVDSQRNKAHSESTMRCDNEHNQPIKFPAGETRPTQSISASVRSVLTAN